MFTIPKILAEVANLVAARTGKILQVMPRLTDAIQALGWSDGADDKAAEPAVRFGRGRQADPS